MKNPSLVLKLGYEKTFDSDFVLKFGFINPLEFHWKALARSILTACKTDLHIPVTLHEAGTRVGFLLPQGQGEDQEQVEHLGGKAGGGPMLAREIGEESHISVL